jgi:hypothetical protein
MRLRASRHAPPRVANRFSVCMSRERNDTL